MKIAVALLTIGAVIVGYALTLPPYKDEQQFRQRYMSLSTGQSDLYWALRDEMLTSKFLLQDYGLTLVAVAVALGLIACTGQLWRHAPATRDRLSGLAIVLPIITVGGFVFDLRQAADREEFPHWADSIAIVEVGAICNLLVLYACLMPHLGLLPDDYYPSAPLSRAVSFKSNLWIQFISVITSIYSMVEIVSGHYWYFIPGVIWVYFFLSIGATRRVAQDQQAGSLAGGGPP